MKGAVGMMQLKGIANELRALFFEELEKLIDKFTKITHEEQEMIKQGIDILERLEIQSKYDMSLESLLQLSHFLKQYSVETVEFYLWSNYCIEKSMMIAEAEEYIKEIEICGYTEVDGLLIYEDGTNLDEYIEKLIKDELLTDAYHIKRLMDIDEIIEMWMGGAAVSEMEDELKHLDLNVLLENPIEEGYITADNKIMMYVELEL